MDFLRRTTLYRWIVRVLLRDFHWLRSVEIGYQKRSMWRKYDRWIRDHELSRNTRDQPVSFGSQPPEFLIIQSFEKTSKDVLMTAIEFIQSQTYPNWRYSLLINNIPTQDIQSLQDNYTKQDPRISIRGDNKTLNDELDQSTKLYVIFLDEHGRLNSRALERFAQIIAERPEAEWIYVDEDQMDANGIRHTPWFKPDWSPELLLSINYLRPAAIRYDLLMQDPTIWHQIGTSSFWTSLLGLLEGATHILHIPQILYHLKSDTTHWPSPDHADDGYQKWLLKYLRSHQKKSPIIKNHSDGTLSLSWISSSPHVSIIIPTLEAIPLLRNCLDSLLTITEYSNYEIVLIDTGSKSRASTSYYRQLQAESRIRLYRREGEFNYSSVNNFGLKKSSGDVILFLNNDVEIIDAEWLDELVRWTEFPQIGVVGAKLLYPNHSIQHAGVIIGLGGHAGHIFLGAEEDDHSIFGSTEWYRNYLAVSGACMMVRRSVVEEVGGFDERFQLAFGDIDFCLRLGEKGYRVMYTPFARLIHHEGATRKRYNPKADLSLALSVLRTRIREGDPFYNSNLSYAKTYPSFVRNNEEPRISRVERIVK